MQNILDQILANPTYTIIAVAIVILLVYSIIKKILKLIIFVVVVLIAYLAYVNYTGGDIKQAVEKTIDSGTETAKDVKRSVEENKQLQDAKKKIERELKK
ncbi:MAG: hypothetical protein ACOYNS_03680 [Bacteroidota bacterium]